VRRELVVVRAQPSSDWQVQARRRVWRPAEALENLPDELEPHWDERRPGKRAARQQVQPQRALAPPQSHLRDAEAQA
jgi:hypothetical protein